MAGCINQESTFFTLGWLIDFRGQCRQPRPPHKGRHSSGELRSSSGLDREVQPVRSSRDRPTGTKLAPSIMVCSILQSGELQVLHMPRHPQVHQTPKEAAKLAARPPGFGSAYSVQGSVMRSMQRDSNMKE